MGRGSSEKRRPDRGVLIQLGLSRVSHTCRLLRVIRRIGKETAVGPGTRSTTACLRPILSELVTVRRASRCLLVAGRHVSHSLSSVNHTPRTHCLPLVSPPRSAPPWALCPKPTRPAAFRSWAVSPLPEPDTTSSCSEPRGRSCLCPDPPVPSEMGGHVAAHSRSHGTRPGRYDAPVCSRFHRSLRRPIPRYIHRCR